MDLGSPPPKLWLPPRPAIIRATELPKSPAEARGIGHNGGPPLDEGFIGVMPVATKRLPAVVTYITTLSSTANATSYNLGSASMPSAGIAVVFHYSDMAANFFISSCSIGGSNATIAASGSGCGVSYRVVAAGANNITIGFPSTAQRCAAAIWLITSYRGATPTDVDSSFNAGTTSHSLGLDIAAGGVGIWGNKHANTNATSWTNATEAFDGSLESTVVVSGASYSAAAAVTRNVTAAWSGSVASDIAGISFR